MCSSVASCPVQHAECLSQGVFVGITSTEFSFIPRPASIAGIGGVGHCFAAGRLSYILGLHGPAVAMDTACSASLVACHSARRALQSDKCQTAVLGGVSAMLLPLVSVSYAAGGLTSSRGRCHTFDARADGFGRGEACGAAILGADGVGDQVHILATAVRQGFGAMGITAFYGAPMSNEDGVKLLEVRPSSKCAYIRALMRPRAVHVCVCVCRYENSS